jgi:hypothetical protein
MLNELIIFPTYHLDHFNYRLLFVVNLKCDCIKISKSMSLMKCLCA